ncbi:MAG: F0F1 ATP synthase subunit gamma [Micrococcales bacterium]|jgi:F-type H+-transporting ATPase subunit gamma|nr:F0F1 ATP synthase subunit gamma [Micrococcales bacterium]
MGGQQRVFRRKIRSVQSTKKITKAMEMIASSRIIKAQRQLEEAAPYTRELFAAISAAASHAAGVEKHPLTAEARLENRAIFLVVTADRGLAGAYSINAIREAEGLTRYLVDDRGFEDVIPYVIGRKGVGFYNFREREIGESWTGFSDQPTLSSAQEIAKALLDRFLLPTEEGGADEIHIVYTHFVNMVTQEVRVRRILPVEVIEEEVDVSEGRIGSPDNQTGDDKPYLPLYDFEPSANAVLDELLPRYVESAVYTALLLSAASEHAARRRACKSATDNAEELIKTYVRLANQARQAEITQEISEIVGGADALSSATAGS